MSTSDLESIKAPSDFPCESNGCDESSHGKHLDKWRLWSQRILQTGTWNTWKDAVAKLPEEVSAIYDGLEQQSGFSFDPVARKRCFKEFFRRASGFAVVSASEVEELIHANLGIKIDNPQLQKLVKSTLEKAPAQNGQFDFHLFLSLISDVMRGKQNNNIEVRSRSFTSWIRIIFPVHPDCRPKKVWDVLVMLLLLYSTFAVPYNAAFLGTGNRADQPLTQIQMFDFLVGAVFMLDIILSFMTAFYREDGMLDRDFGRIAQSYLTTWFFPDLGGSLPWDWILNVLPISTSSGSGLSALRSLKLIRMVRLLRTAKLFKYLKELAHKEGFELFRTLIGVGRSVFILVFVAHILACVFMIIAGDFSAPNWFTHYDDQLQDADNWIRYVVALYWAMVSVTTMGYGDILPVTFEEKLFCTFVAMIGTIVFSYCMATICTLIVSVTGVEHRLVEKMQMVNDYLQFREISTDLRRRVKTHFAVCWRKSGVVHDEGPIITDLPLPLRRALLREIGANIRQQIPFLRGFDDECLGTILSHSKRVQFAEGEIVYEYGEAADEMYLILKGNVEITRPSASGTNISASTKKLDDGCSFGELALFPELATPLRHETATAVTWVSAFILARHNLQVVGVQFPYFLQRLEELCRLKAAELRIQEQSVPVGVLAHAGIGVDPCKIKLCISDLQRDLLRKREREILAPRAYQRGSPIMKLFTTSLDNENKESSEWISLSLVVSDLNELLAVEHDSAGIASDAPRSYGYLLPSLSTFRVLGSEVIKRHVGGRSRSGRLYGISVVVFPDPMDTLPSANSKSAGSTEMSQISTRQMVKGGKLIYLFTWLEDEFHLLLDAVQSVLGTIRRNSSVHNSQTLLQHSILIRNDNDGDQFAPNNSFSKVQGCGHYQGGYVQRGDVSFKIPGGVTASEDTDLQSLFDRVLCLKNQFESATGNTLKGYLPAGASSHLQQWNSSRSVADDERRSTRQMGSAADPELLDGVGSETPFHDSTLGLCEDNMNQVHLHKWLLLSKRLVRSLDWSHVKESIANLPEEIQDIYEDIEDETGFTLDPVARKRCFKEFFKRASGFAVISASEVEDLIQTNLGIEISPGQLQELVNHKLETSPVRNGLFDFPLFASLLSDVMRSIQTGDRVTRPKFKEWVSNVLPIHPECLPKKMWDVLIMALLMYSTFSVPYNVAFVQSAPSDKPIESVEIFDVFVDASFLIDIVASFLTAYYREDGMLDKDFGNIAKKYLLGWFFPDLGGSLPWDYILTALAGNGMGALRSLKLIRMMKLLRTAKLFKSLGELAHKEGFDVFKTIIGIGTSIFLLIFVAHMLSCTFTIISLDESENNWLKDCCPEVSASSENWPRYVTAMYWAMVSLTTMGYGDILPVTHNERMFVIFVTAVGAVVFSYCMGTIASLITRVTGSENLLNEKIQMVNDYLRFRECSTDLRRRIKQYFTVSWRKSGPLYDEAKILEELPTTLRKSVLREIGANTRKQAPIFRGFNNECVGTIMSRMSRIVFTEGQTIYARGDVACEMYLIMKGTVQLERISQLNNNIQSPDTVEAETIDTWANRIVGGGDIFGELALFPEFAPAVRHETAIAKTWVSAYLITREEIFFIGTLYPKLQSRLQELCLLEAADFRVHNAIFADPLGHGTRGAQPCKVKLSISELQREMLQMRERELLSKVGGKEVSKVMKLFKASSLSHDESEQSQWVSLSCVVTDSGEILGIEHTSIGIAADRPCSFGYLLPGLSSYRVLGLKDIQAHLGRKNQRWTRVFGMSLIVFPSAPDALVTSGVIASVRMQNGWPKSSAPEAKVGPTPQQLALGGQQLLIFSWLQEEFNALRECVQNILGDPEATCHTDWLLHTHTPPAAHQKIQLAGLHTIDGDGIAAKQPVIPSTLLSSRGQRPLHKFNTSSPAKAPEEKSISQRPGMVVSDCRWRQDDGHDGSCYGNLTLKSSIPAVTGAPTGPGLAPLTTGHPEHAMESLHRHALHERPALALLEQVITATESLVAQVVKSAASDRPRQSDPVPTGLPGPQSSPAAAPGCAPSILRRRNSALV